MAYLRDQVVVLKKSPYREYDRRYIMYGRRYGLLIAVARGVSRVKSKQASALEVFNFADIMIAQGKKYNHLAVATRDKQRVHLKTLSASFVAGSFSDFSLRLLQTHLADSRIYDLWYDLLSYLTDLDQELTTERAQFLFSIVVIKFLSLLGYVPNLQQCASCGIVFNKHDLKKEVFFSKNNHNIFCSSCFNNSFNYLKLQGQVLILFKYIQQERSLIKILRLTLEKQLWQDFINLTQELWSILPLNNEPHGLKTLQFFLSKNKQ